MARNSPPPNRMHLALLAGVGLALASCASNPPPKPVVIDYRTGAPAPPRAPGKPFQPPAVQRVAPPQGVSSSPAVAEAAGLAPQMGARPGGSMRQPKDNPADRAVRIVPGDSLSAISQRYAVNQRALIATNDLSPPYALKVGQVIYLPPPNIHVVETGETLYTVAQRFHVDTRSLALMNGLTRPWTVWPGDELALPPLASDEPMVATVVPASKTIPASQPVASVRSAAPKEAPLAEIEPETETTTLPPGPVRLTQPSRPLDRKAVNVAGAKFLWPITGDILSGYGVGADGTRNDGVDIAAEAGADVKTAAAGEVVYAGDELTSFGNLVLVKHAEGWVTAYAHAQELLVKVGDSVKQGQVIAHAGQTGMASRPLVHFELRRGKLPVDPEDRVGK